MTALLIAMLPLMLQYRITVQNDIAVPVIVDSFVKMAECARFIHYFWVVSFREYVIDYSVRKQHVAHTVKNNSVILHQSASSGVADSFCFQILHCRP